MGTSPDRSISAAIEKHEAEVWARCVESCANLPGNPLGAVVDHRTLVPLTTLSALDSPEFNRVLAVGLPESTTAATAAAIDATVEFYRGLGQSCFRIELAPIAETDSTIDALHRSGFRPTAEVNTKLWRALDGAIHMLDEVETPDVDVRRLTPSDADRIATLNVRSWGSWTMTRSMHPWFFASVGSEGFTHYGVFDRDRLVATGALCIDGGLAWAGFDATHPRFQGRSLRRSLTLQRLADAKERGCEIVHAEAHTSSLTTRGRFFDRSYQRVIYAYGPAEAGSAPAADGPDPVRPTWH